MRTRLLAVLLAAATVIAGPACGGGDDGTPVAVLASASTQTVDAKSSRVALTVEIDDSTAPGGKRKITGEGAFDFATGHGTMAMDTAALGLPGVSGSIQVISLGQEMYVQVPAGLLPGKPWLKIDLATLGQSAGFDVSGLQQLGSNDPSASLRFLKGAQNVEERGEAEVRGVNTTQYHFTIDLEKTKAEVPADLRDDIDRLIEQLGSSTLPADAWVDAEERVRRVRMTIAGKGAVGDSVVTQEYFDFGTKVDAVAPPADQVSDFAQLLQGAGQQPG